MAKLSERAILSALHVGVWSGMAIDRDVTEEVSENHKADLKDAGRYNKRLISPVFLKPTSRVQSVARRTHQILTLPWEDNGKRILSTTGHKHYTEQMRLLRLQFDAAVREFLSKFDDAVKEAKPRLGTMFDVEEYPTAAEVKDKFWFDVEITGVPEAGDFRAELSDASVKAIVKDIERRADDRLQAAMNDVFERILKVTGHMVERLKNYTPPTGKTKGEKGSNFQDSTVYNIKELADLLPALNLTGDKRLDDLQQRLLSDLVEHSPEILKSNPKIRSETARKAEKIYSKVKGFLA